MNTSQAEVKADQENNQFLNFINNQNKEAKSEHVKTDQGSE